VNYIVLRHANTNKPTSRPPNMELVHERPHSACSCNCADDGHHLKFKTSTCAKRNFYSSVFLAKSLNQCSQKQVHDKCYHPQHIARHPAFLTSHAARSGAQIMQPSCSLLLNLLASSCLSNSAFRPSEHCCSPSVLFYFQIVKAAQTQLNAVLRLSRNFCSH
jgi:hypothetical protein